MHNAWNWLIPNFWLGIQKQGLLLPTRLQVEEAEKIATAAQKRLRGKMEVLYVLPDYYLERPKPCMYGWGGAILQLIRTAM